MKKTVLKSVVLIVTLLAGFSFNASGQFSGGNGGPSYPFQISTPADLKNMSNFINSGSFGGAYFILTANIDLSEYQSGEGWVPIGTTSKPFVSNFNGKGYTITNIKINRSTSDYQGLFGCIGAAGKIDSVIVSSSTIIGQNSVAGIAGQNAGIVSQCRFAGTVNGSSNVGGVVGVNSNAATVTKCYNEATISGASYIGGVIGVNSSGTVSICCNTGVVNGVGGVIAGIAGQNANGTIINCYNTGTIAGSSEVGGVVGVNAGGGANITKCYNSAAITAAGNAGGIVGNNGGGTIMYCAAVNESIAGGGAVNRIAGVPNGPISNNYALSTMVKNGGAFSGTETENGISKTIMELKTQSTYESGLSWDFFDIWQMAAANFPLLKGVSPTPEFAGGSGTTADPYIITTPEQLDKVRKYLTASFVMANDIDLADYQSGEGWVPIGNPFSGKFNGKGYSITNLKINRNASYQGLFGVIIPGGVVDSIHLVNSEIKGTQYTGGIAGQNGGTIHQCHFAGTVTGISQVGGIAGINIPASTIIKCYNEGTIQGNATTGGLVGQNNGGTVFMCYNKGSVSGQGGLIAGICGQNTSPGTITNCYNTGTINGGAEVGGIVGVNAGALVTKCYNSAGITSNANIGGIVGNNSGGSVTYCAAVNSYLTKGYSGAGNRIIGGNAGGLCTANYALVSMTMNGSPFAGETGENTLNGLDKTKEELLAQSTYETGLSWDFTTTWFMFSANFPLLQGVSKSPASDFGGGNGSEADPFVIKTADHLNNVRNQLEAHYILANDIDLSAYQSGEGWQPIGYPLPFKGKFNGKGYAITKLKINRPTGSYQSLFGVIQHGSIDSVNVMDASVIARETSGILTSLATDETRVSYCKVSGTLEGYGALGGITGRNLAHSVIDKCVSDVTISAISPHVGGIAGHSEGTISRCVNQGNIEQSGYSGGNYTGGIVGWNSGGTITESSNTGNISSTDLGLGGIAGSCESLGVITACHNSGNMSNTRNVVGGIVGLTKEGSAISECTNEGTINGASFYIGGIAGVAEYGSISTSHNKGTIIGNSNVSAYVGGIVGYNTQSIISECSNTASVDGFKYIGGLTGINGREIMKSYNTGNVTGVDNVGGIAGINEYGYYGGTISSCYNKGNVTGETFVGGVAGINSNALKNCYNTGVVSALAGPTGGIAGLSKPELDDDDNPVIMSSINFGAVKGGSDNAHGGIVGKNAGDIYNSVAANTTITGTNANRIVGSKVFGYIQNNYALENMLVNGTAVSTNNVDGLEGLGKSFSDLQKQTTYEQLSSNYANEWYICNLMSFPILKWQPAICANITLPVYLNIGASQSFDITVINNGYTVDPISDIFWTNNSAITEVQSADHIHFTLKGVASGIDTIRIELINGNILYIVANTNVHTIVASSGDNGTISPNGNVIVALGSNQSFDITGNTGYQISQLLVDESSITAAVGASSYTYTFTNVIADHIISVLFEEIPIFTITATAGTGGAIAPNGATTLTYGETQEYTITANEGYKIKSVSVDDVAETAAVGASSYSYTFSNVTADHTISAEFEQITYTITATAGTNGSISPAGTTTVSYGSNQAYTITASNDYLIKEVKVDGVAESAAVGKTTYNYTFSNVKANHTISATFEIANPELTGITVNNQPQTISSAMDYMAACGEQSVSMTLTAVGEVKVNGSAYTNGSPISLTGDKTVITITVTAGSNTATYTLTVAKALGSTTPLYIERWGATIAIVNNPANNGGYTFDQIQWYKASDNTPAGTGAYVVGNISTHYADVHAVETGAWHHTCRTKATPAPVQIVVYPNPVLAAQTLNVKLPEGLNEVNIDVYDINGKLVKQHPRVTTTLTAPTGTGIYVLKIQLPDGSITTEKIVVK